MGDKSYYEKNKKKVKKRALAYYYANREAIRTKQNARLKDPEAQRAAREYQLKKMFGMTGADYDALLQKQGNCCAICRTTDPTTARTKYFAVDHDHATGRVRGLLCGKCNLGIGNLREDPEILSRALEYLRTKQ
jgi:hypothetical protein